MQQEPMACHAAHATYTSLDICSFEQGMQSASRALHCSMGKTCHLPLGVEVSQVLVFGKGALEGGRGGDVGGQAHGLAHIGCACQQQEVLGKDGRNVLQRDGGRKQQGGGHAEPLHEASSQVGR